MDPDGRHVGELDGAHPQISDLAEPLQGLDQAGDTDTGWGTSEPLQGRRIMASLTMARKFTANFSNRVVRRRFSFIQRMHRSTMLRRR